MKTITLSDDASNWLKHGERGISSEAIFEQLSGVPILEDNWLRDTPADPSDLRRCRLLLEAVPEFRPRLHEMRLRSSAWKALVDVWQELCDLMDRECPDWRDGTGRAPDTFSRMQGMGL